MKIPVEMETVDMTTGESTRVTTHAILAPARPGTCEECGRTHPASQPHDATSLHYQYHHYGRTGRWPDWRDAMAHCSDEDRARWTQALEQHGIDVASGQLRPKSTTDLPGPSAPAEPSA